jgi:hypothetical protein
LHRNRRITNLILMLLNTFLVAVSNRGVGRAQALRQGFSLGYNAYAAIAFALLFWSNTALAQSSSQDAPRAIVAPTPLPESALDDQSQSTSATASRDSSSLGSSAKAKQTKRILWIFPNYRSVSADTQLPPLSMKDKFWLATQDSFDYSSFITAGMIAGTGQAKKSYPEFGQGAKGYGRYFWHAVADQAVGNYLTEAIVPEVTREDPRYYTLGHGGFFKRTAYAVSRLLVTRTDSGRETINLSEIVGNGAGAGISNLYYPSQERTWTKTGQKWVTQIALDGVFNIAKEFWPDVNHAIFHGKY